MACSYECSAPSEIFSNEYYMLYTNFSNRQLNVCTVTQNVRIKNKGTRQTCCSGSGEWFWPLPQWQVHMFLNEAEKKTDFSLVVFALDEFIVLHVPFLINTHSVYLNYSAGKKNVVVDFFPIPMTCVVYLHTCLYDVSLTLFMYSITMG